MHSRFVLLSLAEWCDRRFELFTAEPKGDTYSFECPSCRRTHEFELLERQ